LGEGRILFWRLSVRRGSGGRWSFDRMLLDVRESIQSQGLVGGGDDSLPKSLRVGGRAAHAAGGILLIETQAQRRIAGRARLAPGLITIQAGGHFLTPESGIF
jgi:hypothetical protein